MQTSWLLRAFTLHITFFGLLLALATNAMGQDPALETRVESWLKERFKEAGEELPLRGIALTWRVEYPPSGTADDLARMRQIVQGKPIHPLRSELAKLEYELTHGPALEEVTLWYERHDRWRHNRNNLNRPDIPYLDEAHDGDTTWGMTPTQVNIVDPRNAPAGRNYAGLIHTIQSHVHSFLTSNLQSCNRLGVTLRDVEPTSEGGWTAVFETRDETREDTMEGTWSDIAQQPFIDRKTLTRSPIEGGAGRMIEYFDWRYDATLDRWIPHEVVHTGADGSPMYRLRFVGAEEYDPDALNRLIKPPSVTGADPIRGEYTFASLNDYRPNVATGFAVQDGQLTKKPLPVPMPRSAIKLRQVGWVVLALLVASLVGFRIWQRRQ